ncbi:MAG: TIM barrel protein [Thermoguttaceae bacterium]|jgi:sugar phosphate isomerase/epimerase|nr:TIM barrel protein [Thermoguttaceae bacterium]MDI9445897.1 TIM barrel protein [Planctomycetota bacterium]
MRHRILLATLLLALNLATSAAQEASPALQARAAAQAAAKKLQWRIAVAAYSFRQFTFFETVDQVAELGVDLIEGFSFQKIGKGVAGTLDPLKMSDEDIAKVSARLQASGVSLIALYYGSFPADESACRTIFENSKKLGVEYFVSEPKPDRLPMLDKLAQEYGILVGLHGHSKQSSPNTWHPELVAKLCQPFSPAIGAFSDTGHWLRSQLDPAAGVAILKDRVVGFEVHDLHAFDASGRDVPLGTGVGKLQDMFDTLARVKKGPVLLSVEYTSNPENPADDVKQCIQFLDRQAIRLAGSSP